MLRQKITDVLDNGCLYLVTESGLALNRSNADIVRDAIPGGVKIVQLREKDWSKEEYLKEARELARICHDAGVLFVVNDYPDIAKEIGADGLHLGQEDMPISEARAVVGEKVMIGKSTHSKEQALSAQHEGADYISIGPVYPTRKKPNPVGTELIVSVIGDLRIPFVAIGGIKAHNVSDVLAAGANSIAVISALVEAHDVKREAEEFLKLIYS